MHNIRNITNNKTKILESNSTKNKFKEILCPKSRNELIVENCYNCSYCQKMTGKHQSGRMMSSFICIYKPEGEDFVV